MSKLTPFVAALALSLTSPLAIIAESYQITPQSLTEHVKVLASDSLEGREVGEPGELMAAKYIASIFKSADLKPGGDKNGYLQMWEFTKEIQVTDENQLTINGITLVLHDDFRPLRQSASGSFTLDKVVPVGFGITSEDSQYDDYADLDATGKGVLIKRYSPTPDDYPDVEFGKYESLNDKIRNAIKHNATGVFFITPEEHDDSLGSMEIAYVTAKDIPIFWLKRTALNKLNIDIETPEPFSAEILTDLVRIRDTGYNVIGILPAENDTSILIGAHLDHLGWGNHVSLYTGDEKKIHYGADDNASGVATLLELARLFSSERSKLNYSIRFIAFSGEERGILGSSHYAKEGLEDPRLARMMINLDMIGRLKDQDNGLAIMGTGTCNEFKGYFDSLPDQGIKLAFKESGIGPSDHTAFYNQDIPVLFFFTGAHEDYHRPSDTWDKLDFDGLAKIATFISEVSSHFDNYPESLTFQKVKDDSKGGRRSSLSVSLGVMPDFVAEVEGLKIDGVSLDKPADRAGMLKGDIVIKIGEYDVGDIYDYMDALGKFRKGDTVDVKLLRVADTVAVEVIFD